MSRMFPTEARTSYSAPRYRPMVRAFAGDSTMTRCLPPVTLLCPSSPRRRAACPPWPSAVVLDEPDASCALGGCSRDTVRRTCALCRRYAQQQGQREPDGGAAADQTGGDEEGGQLLGGVVEIQRARQVGHPAPAPHEAGRADEAEQHRDQPFRGAMPGRGLRCERPDAAPATPVARPVGGPAATAPGVQTVEGEDQEGPRGHDRDRADHIAGAVP